MKRKLLLCSILVGLTTGTLAAQEAAPDQTKPQDTVAQPAVTPAAPQAISPEDAERQAKEERMQLVRKIFGYFFLAVLIGWMFWPKKRHEEDDVEEIEHEDDPEILEDEKPADREAPRS